jgi:hypothetical protein
VRKSKTGAAADSSIGAARLRTASSDTLRSSRGKINAGPHALRSVSLAFHAIVVLAPSRRASEKNRCDGAAGDVGANWRAVKATVSTAYAGIMSDVDSANVSPRSQQRNRIMESLAG